MGHLSEGGSAGQSPIATALRTFGYSCPAVVYPIPYSDRERRMFGLYFLKGM